MSLRHLVSVLSLSALTLALPVSIHAQADQTILSGESGIPTSPNKEDVRAIGRGKTGIAWNPGASAMLYNPALLATPRTTYEVLGVETFLPTASINAINFLSSSNTIHQFKTGDFLKQLRLGVGTILDNNAGPAARAAAVQQVNQALQFANDLQAKVLGTTDNPKLHGVAAIPSIQGQIGNFGFSLYGSLHSMFVSFPTPQLVQLYQLRLPTNFDALPLDQQIDDAVAILNAIAPLFVQDPNDPLGIKLNYYEAIPTTFAAAYLDIVGAFGYGYQLTPAVGVGGTLKIVNRRFTTKIIDPDHYNGLLKEAAGDFNNSSTGVTLDLGATYYFRRSGTRLGLALQNIIPLPKVTSTAELTVVTTDPADNVVKNRIQLPLTLKSPFLVNVGAAQPIPWVKGLTVSLDWVDAIAQDTVSYGSYFERFRLGAEYRYETSPGGFAAIGRLGLADGRFTGGLGFDLWGYFGLDGAYAYDTVVGSNSWFAGFRFGF